MRTRLFWLCCALLVAMTGCGQPKEASDRIEIWHWMTDRQEALEALARKYERETGVKVKLELFAPSDAYTQKIIAAAQADVLPDIYGVLDERTIFAAFIKAGYVADLAAEFGADDGRWQKALFPRAMDNNRFAAGNIDGVAPGIYGVPIDVTNLQLVYNRELLKKAGISSPPRTFDEFLTQINALKRVGVTPFVSGFGELWLTNAFATIYALNIMGEEKVFATFRGEVPYTNPDWLRVFALFQTLAKKGAFMEGVVTKGNKYAEQDFALGRAAFAFNGSWCVNVYHEMNPGLDYGVVALPAVNVKNPLRMWGGAGSSFVVNAHSANQDKAVAFLKWLTAMDQQAYLAEQTRNLPSNREALGVIPTVLADFAKAMDLTTHPAVWPVNEDPVVIEAVVKGIQSIIIGEATPEKVARDVQKAKERQMGKVKR